MVATRLRIGRFTDPDVARYLKAIGPTNNAADINNFVVGCKADGTWGLCDWIWPFAGKTLASALIPLKSPSKALTPLTPVKMVASDYSETIGVTGDGSTKYLTCPVNWGSYNVGNFSMSGYLSVPMDVPNGGVIIGGGDPARQIWPQQTNGASIVRFPGALGQNTLPSPIDPIGLYLMSECAQNGYMAFRGTPLLASPTQLTVAGPTAGPQLVCILATTLNNTAIQQWLAASCGFAHIGTLMGLVQIASFSVRVETLMIAMNRRPSPTTTVRLYGVCDGLEITGQSLATATNGTLVSGAKQIYGHVTFPPGPGNWNNNQDFSKLTELSDNGQVSATTAVDGMGAVGYPRPWFVGGAPVGATAYSGLARGTNPYNISLIGHRAAFNQLAALGVAYTVRGVECVHGEQDDLNNSLTYQANLTTWQSNYQSDLQAITGQASAIPMYFSQEHSWCGYIARTTALVTVAQYNAWAANPTGLILVCPKYMMTYASDHVHLVNGTQYRWMGEYYGKAIYQTITTGTAFVPLAPLSVTRTGASIVLVMNKGGLVIDTTLVTDPSGTYASRTFLTAPTSATNSTVTSFQGFEFMDDTVTSPSANVTAIAISTTNIVNDTVTLTLSATPTGTNKRIRYAFTGTANVAPGPLTGPRGNMRDGDTSYPSQFGNTLYNWLTTFDLAAT